MKKRLFAVLLCFCLLVGLLPTAAFAAGTDTDKAIQLGTGGISGWDSADGYDYIYFGNWEASDEYTTSGPIKWRVLDTKTNMDNATEGDGLFLLSDILFGTGKNGGVYFQQVKHWVDSNSIYHQGSAPFNGDHSTCLLWNAWQGSDAQKWCNSFYDTYLTTQEQSAVLATTKSDGEFIANEGKSSSYRYTLAASENILNSDKVFFLSAEEANEKAYGFTEYTVEGWPYSADHARVAYYGNTNKLGSWWLRSPVSTNVASTVGSIPVNGFVFSSNPAGDKAARPAFNLNQNSVLFTSAAVDGKSSGAVGASSLQAISDYSSTEWKLTLLDTKRSFSANANGQTSVSAPAGDNVQITYSGAQTGNNEYVSVLLCDSSDNVLYYGNIAQNSESGTASVTIPADLEPGSYTFKVFSEQCNGDKQTDYASAFADISLTVTDTTVPPTYFLAVDLQGGSGSTMSGEYAEGAVINIDAGTRSNYHFSGWISSNGGCFADASSPSTTFTMPAADTTITANWQYNVGTGKAVQIGASQIKGGQASSVYFGNYQQSSDGSGGYNTDPVKWRVLSDADGTLFLLSDQNLDVQPYNTSRTSITWENCTLRTWLNGTFLTAAFSSNEQGAIASTYVYNLTQSDGRSDPNPSYNISGGNDTTDKIFLLSIEEANNSGYFPNGDSSRISINNDYVASRNTSMSGAGAEDYWWLRSPGTYDYTAADVTDDGYLNYGHSADFTFIAVRPAFNLDLNSVLFTSAADNSGHISFGTVIPDYVDSEWKVTLKDNKDFSSNASVSGATTLTAGYSDTTLTISHAALASLSNDYTDVTAALTDASGNLFYYGSVNSNTSATESTVTIPAGLSEGTYTLSIYGEDWNGANLTDYATGTPYTVPITVDGAPPTPSGAALYGATLSLDGTIGVNFYVDMTGVEEADRDSYKMMFTVNGETKAVAFDKDAYRTFGDKTCYRFTCPVYAKQMADTITANLYCGDTLVRTVTYSVKTYCDRMIGNTSADGLSGLLKAILNYGSAAQMYFGYNAGSLANADLTEDEKSAIAAVTVEDLASYASVPTGTLPEGLDISATLILDSSVTIRFYINGATDGYTFTLDGKEVTPTECTSTNGNHYVDVTNIGARQLATAHTLAISDSTGEVYSVSYSALSYAYSMVSDTTKDEKIQNVAKALYLYYDASTKYNNWMKN